MATGIALGLPCIALGFVCVARSGHDGSPVLAGNAAGFQCPTTEAILHPIHVGRAWRHGGMRERAEATRGSLSITSSPGAGCTVRLLIAPHPPIPVLNNPT